MSLNEKIVEIIKVEPLEGYCLGVTFNDGKTQEIDFEPFLKSSAHPQIKQFLQPEKFATYHLEYGDLIWGDYELCFPIMDLYQNRIFSDSGQGVEAA